MLRPLFFNAGPDAMDPPVPSAIVPPDLTEGQLQAVEKRLRRAQKRLRRARKRLALAPWCDRKTAAIKCDCPRCPAADASTGATCDRCVGHAGLHGGPMGLWSAT